jgi:hypothetical protein
MDDKIEVLVNGLIAEARYQPAHFYGGHMVGERAIRSTPHGPR